MAKAIAKATAANGCSWLSFFAVSVVLFSTTSEENPFKSGIISETQDGSGGRCHQIYPTVAQKMQGNNSELRASSHYE